MTEALDTHSIVVRNAYAADAAILAAIHARCFARAWDEAAMAQFLGMPGALTLLASREAGAHAQGFLIVHAAADEAELITLCVLPDHRHQGLARDLLLAALETLKRGGTKRLFLEVEDGNDAALVLYSALGARPVGRRAAYYENGADALIFSLALSGAGPDDDG
jgi:ribosomal-protein-alanine N-acetyltransferase